MSRNKGFTLLELLTVIAIIAVLAGITFPVFARVRENSYRSGDLSNMNAIRSALQLYQADQGAYPPAILGYATGYTNVIPSAGDIVPADRWAGPLYPRRVDSLETLRPAYVRPSAGNLNTEFTTAVWPNRPGPGGAGQPQQRFGPETTVVRCVAGAVQPSVFYRLSGYDAARVPDAGGRTELRYTLFWSGWSVPADPCNPDPSTESGSASDSPRQLGYSDPADSTVITWNSFFRDYDGGLPTRTKKDIVLFLSGSARPMDSRSVSEQSYALLP